MRARLRGIALCAALVLPASESAESQVNEIAATELTLPAAPGATHDLAVPAYLFDGSRWDAARAQAALAESGAILAQCGNAVTVRLARLQAPRPTPRA